jgi:hypothetical protein
VYVRLMLINSSAGGQQEEEISVYRHVCVCVCVRARARARKDSKSNTVSSVVELTIQNFLTK